MHARFFIVDRPHIGLFRNNIVKQRSLISGLGRQMLTTLALYPKCNKKTADDAFYFIFKAIIATLENQVFV